MKPASAELHLPQELRRYLASPWTLFATELVEGPRAYVGQTLALLIDPFRTAIVGDVVCSTVIDYVGLPRLCIADSRTMRFREARVDTSLFEEVSECRNEPGSLSRECIDRILELLKLQVPSLLIVRGEEDLLALPLVATGAVDVAFGIPSRGVCIVRRDLSNVVAAVNVLSRFRGFERWSLGRCTEILG